MDIPSNANELNNEDMNRKKEVYREAFYWTVQNYLLVQRKIKTKKILQKISEKMKMQGYNVFAIQVENKYKLLERSYKNVITHNKKSRRNRLSCPYEITIILGGKHNIEPLLVIRK
ncbi:hypothetical protein P5V15_015082 [Pogonomyrmex californicus]